MSRKDDLVEQNIREYLSRMKHIDELYEKAHEAIGDSEREGGSRQELDKLAMQRAVLKDKVEEINTIDVNHWREDMIESAGPMAVWDILAQKLEDFIERHT